MRAARSAVADRAVLYKRQPPAKQVAPKSDGELQELQGELSALVKLNLKTGIKTNLLLLVHKLTYSNYTA